MANKKKYENLIVWGSICFLVIFAVAVSFIVVNAKKDSKSREEESDTLNTNISAGPSALFHVTKVIDGDTIKVIGSDNIELDIRLAEIDAPEIDQPYGKESKAELEKHISGKETELRDITKGRYGRFVANVYCDGVWINIESVKNGFAWRYKGSDSNEMLKAETNARGKTGSVYGVSQTQFLLGNGVNKRDEILPRRKILLS
ncbi:MAG: thermonuclease family protein [Phycisphaerae bacterium]|nr:thermonuclease family protein [Phycisphaerae bacterium]